MENKKKSELLIVLPLTGETVSIDQVPDPIFADKMMGDGAAVIPTDGRIVAPVDGTLTMIAPTKHAFGFKADNGPELLVHVGLETVGLNGEPFKVHKKEATR